MLKGYRPSGNCLRKIVAGFALTQGFSPPPRHLVKYNFTSVIYYFDLQQSNVKNFSGYPAFTLARTSSRTECYVAGFFCCIGEFFNACQFGCVKSFITQLIASKTLIIQSKFDRCFQSYVSVVTYTVTIGDKGYISDNKIIIALIILQVVNWRQS